MLVFQKCWNIFKDHIMEVVHEYYNEGFLDWRNNTTFITLIPKKKGVATFHDYRPISLVGGIYKIVSKVLANRLRNVLLVLISPVKSAFVGERQILDGVLVANECIDSCLRAKENGILCKVDISKAYDNVNLGFLQYVLKRMGFKDKWCKWIHTCVSSAHFSILFEGSPFGFFTSQEGLRQGDPISPFLFNLVMEALSRLVYKAMDLGFLHGFKPALSGPKVAMLQFADDTLFMCDASVSQVLVLKVILLIFVAASGLKSNMKKTKVMAVGDVENLQCISHVLGCDIDTLLCHYLGLPLGASYKSTVVWKPVIERINCRLGTWQRKYLSKARRLVLIKSVLSNLPIYYMSVLVMPASVAVSIERKMKSFL
ncbi:Line-1 retrotransposable element orf2 protein [Thalictrum thalictroides]|uniref:Line-1 retrotransposable element orf2 protein n=1 Tax=Thalictrum thalictroides TaxID=46969 RepID=A0A7J6VGI3_THATH|nr:Line-1 retrotransposable element orf2 protein [Thalictrum thalictroides]